MKRLKNGKLPQRTKDLAIAMCDRYNRFHHKDHPIEDMIFKGCFFLCSWGYISWAIKEGVVNADGYTRESKTVWCNPNRELLEVMKQGICEIRNM